MAHSGAASGAALGWDELLNKALMTHFVVLHDAENMHLQGVTSGASLYDGVLRAAVAALTGDEGTAAAIPLVQLEVTWWLPICTAKVSGRAFWPSPAVKTDLLNLGVKIVDPGLKVRAARLRAVGSSRANHGGKGKRKKKEERSASKACNGRSRGTRQKCQ